MLTLGQHNKHLANIRPHEQRTHMKQLQNHISSCTTHLRGFFRAPCLDGAREHLFVFLSSVCEHLFVFLNSVSTGVLKQRLGSWDLSTGSWILATASSIMDPGSRTQSPELGPVAMIQHPGSRSSMFASMHAFVLEWLGCEHCLRT